jgi:hypothetical protein
MEAELVKRQDRYDLYGVDGAKIASSAPNPFGKLSKENCDKLFEVVDVEKLFIETPHNVEDEKDYWKIRAGYIEGFNKAMELNKDKLFTAEDVAKAYDKGQILNIKGGQQSGKKYVQSLQQPTEIDVEIEMDICGDKVYAVPEPKLDENGCLILTKNII